MLSCGLPELYIDDITARADRTGEPNAFKGMHSVLVRPPGHSTCGLHVRLS